MPYNLPPYIGLPVATIAMALFTHLLLCWPLWGKYTAMAQDMSILSAHFRSSPIDSNRPPIGPVNSSFFPTVAPIDIPWHHVPAYPFLYTFSMCKYTGGLISEGIWGLFCVYVLEGLSINLMKVNDIRKEGCCNNRGLRPTDRGSGNTVLQRWRKPIAPEREDGQYLIGCLGLCWRFNLERLEFLQGFDWLR